MGIKKNDCYAYLCNGEKYCYGIAGCGLADSLYGTCFHTCDINCAVNRSKILLDKNYTRDHMDLALETDTDKYYIERE